MVSRSAAYSQALQAAATDRLRAHYEAELGSARQELERQGQLRQQAALEQQQDARRHQMTLQSQCACALRCPPSLPPSAHRIHHHMPFVGLPGLGCGWNLAVAQPPPPPPPGPCVCVRRLEVQRRQFAAREADAVGALQSEMEAAQAAAAATSASLREELARLRARCGRHEQLLEASRVPHPPMVAFCLAGWWLEQRCRLAGRQAGSGLW